MSIAYRKSLQSDTDLNIPIFCAASIHSALLTAQQRIYFFFYIVWCCERALSLYTVSNLQWVNISLLMNMV